MMLEVANLIWQKETIRHKLVVNWEESLKSANNNAENILFGEMIHQGVPIEYALSHLNYVKIMVS